MNKKLEEKDELIKPACFVMMPISDADGYQSGHFAEVYEELIEPAVQAAGYECHLATSTSAAHMIQLEVVTKIATAPLCICDLSTNNPNVLFEYGIRQAFDLPTVLIKDNKTKRIFDLSGFRDIEYDHSLRIANILSARQKIEIAIKQTVDGAGDDEQVFSLVKLMKLTKAALPQGDINREDARLELLERKIDGLISITSRSRSSLSETIINTPEYIELDDLDGGQVVTAVKNGSRYMIGGDAVVYDGGKGYVVRTFDDVRKMQFYRDMNPQRRMQYRHLFRKSFPNIVD